MTTQDRIKDIQGQINEILAPRPAFLEAFEKWHAQANEPCNFSNNNKQADCRKDRANKAAEAQSAYAQLQVIDKKVSELSATKVALEKQLASENIQAEKLAEKGLSNAALVVEAEGRAKAAQATADAQAQAITTDATANASSKKTITIVIVVVVLVALIAIAISIKKKLKKRK